MRPRVVALGAVAAVLLAGCGGTDRPIASGAARLVPADALVFVHLSTDTSRAATKAAQKLARRFPGYSSAVRSIVGRLSAPGCPIDTKRLLRGKEAALALLDAGSGAAGSLVIVDTGDLKPLRSSACGELQTEKLGRFYVIGQPQALQLARELNRGHGKSLAADPAYKAELAKLPPGRVADAWVTRDGVRRLLAPQSGVLGLAGTLLDAPGLRAVALGLSAKKGGARVSVRSLRTAVQTGKPFEPKLMSSVPWGSFAYLGVRGLSGPIGRLLGLVGPQAARIVPLLRKAAADLRPVLDLFKGEVALSLISYVPAPILTLVAKPPDIAKAAKVLRDAKPSLDKLLKGSDIKYAVVNDEIVVSTNPQGIASVRNHSAAITKNAEWRDVMGTAPDAVTSLLFLDFSQLLRLGEQTGLDKNKAYLAVRSDLRKIKAVGVHTSSAGDESTAELDLSIP